MPSVRLLHFLEGFRNVFEDASHSSEGGAWLEEVENFISRVKVDAEVERSRLASL
jgi:hypothetical protein